MALASRKGRKVARFALPPILALIMVFAGVSAALAFNGSTNAGCNDFRTCYYADINLSPSGGANDVLNISGLNQNWQDIPEPAGVCGGIITHTWNDCASSVLSRRTSTTEYAW